MAQEKFGACIGTYAPCADRFVMEGYHPALTMEQMLEMAVQTADIAGVEVDFPFMPPIGEDASAMGKILKKTGMKLCTIEIDHYSSSKWQYGALTSHDPAVRRDAIEVSKRGIDAALELGAEQVNLWLGHDGFDYPMEAEFPSFWDWTIEGIREIGEHRRQMKICLEYKPREPRVYSLMATVCKTLLIANATGLKNVGVNIDIGHALMGQENIAESAVLCDRYHKLFYLHLNDNYREWDDDMMVGSVHVWETLEFCYWLNKLGYRGWHTLDIYPYRQNAIEAAEESIQNLKALYRIARSLDEHQLTELRRTNNYTAIMRMLREATFK
jgi:sugar phosphate isomerase/epimerase